MKNNSGTGSGFMVFIIIVICIYLVGSCSGDRRTKFDDDLENGVQKYYTGQDMNEDEYNAVKYYNEWKDKNTDKTYEEWDD